MTLELVQKQPAGLRVIIGKHLALPRWQDTCDFYNGMIFSLFEYAPTILTSVKPEQYLH